MLRILLLFLMTAAVAGTSLAQTATKQGTAPAKKPAATTTAKPTGAKPAAAKPSTTTPAKKTTTTQAKKPQPATDKLHKIDNVTILRGKIIRITSDSVYYYPSANPKVRKRVALNQLYKIVYANGTTKMIEPEPVAEEPEKEVVEAVDTTTVTKEPEPAPAPVVVVDEIVLKTGAVITGRILSQQKAKIGYRAASSMDSGPELFIPTNKIWKLKYGATGQEVVLNPVKEKAAAKEKKPKPEKAPKEPKAPREPKPAVAQAGDGPVYKKFKVDVTTGYSHFMEEGADVNFGFNFSVEPKYNVMDNLAVGLKLEAAGFFLATDEDFSTLLSLPSASLTSEYYFGKKTVRPYIGVAAGMYFPKLYLFDDELIKESGDATFGFAPRAGVQIGHFRIGAEYNIVEDGSFLSVKLGASIGGGKKKRR